MEPRDANFNADNLIQGAPSRTSNKNHLRLINAILS